MAAFMLRSRKVFILLVVLVAAGIYLWTTKIRVKDFSLFLTNERSHSTSISDFNSFPGKEDFFLLEKEQATEASNVYSKDQLNKYEEKRTDNDAMNAEKHQSLELTLEQWSTIGNQTTQKSITEKGSSFAPVNLKEMLEEFRPVHHKDNVSESIDGSTDTPFADSDTLGVHENVLETLFDEDYVDLGGFPKGAACPYTGIRKLKNSTERVQKGNKQISCVSHKPNETDCERAAREYEVEKKPLKCPLGSQKVICLIEDTWRSSPESELKIHCDLSPCKGGPITVKGIHPSKGISDEEKDEQSFASAKALETFLAHFIIVNTLDGFNFCFLRCKAGRKKIISQMLTFPPILETKESEFLPGDKDPNLINFNVVVLDSVSRVHFYRSLPKSVNTLRTIVYNDSINATALDFELLQSSAPYTFHNIRAFMSGKTDFNYVEHSNGTYGIDVLYKKLKNQGYYTVLQEDSCWFDEWGSLFSNNVFQNKTPQTTEEIEKRWDKFKELVKGYYIDDYGLSHSTCDVLQQYNITNQFNKPRRLCFGGKVFAEHFLDYSLSVFQGYIDSGKRQPIFSYTHLSPGHEVTGTRIRQIDESLSGYLYSIAHENDTLTMVFSDHGPKTTKFSFQTMEGRAEVYDSLLFAIVPRKVANILGLRRMRALVINQKRLLTTLDVHKAIMSIADPEKITSNTYLQEGMFSEIPFNRTCADISIKPSAVCKCEGWEQKFPDNDAQFTALAELALGSLNNDIQESFLNTQNRTAGFGRCQRLVGRSFEKIRRRKVGANYLVTMDIVVFPENEIFEVQVTYPAGSSTRRQISYPQVVSNRRVSIYRRFEKCVDHGVRVESCVCDSHGYGRELSRKNHWKWFEIKSASDILETVFQANSFGTESEVKDLHETCLLLVTRKRENLGMTFEVANACSQRRYKVRLTGKAKGKHLITRKLPLSTTVEPRTVHFVFSVQYLEKPFGFNLITSFVGYTV
ncbi:uncharacterized protein [Montipora foliosa]|uniref:uncharacterized protein n=1 Tax=Montipora foliosa TaxID=591990 RepID=UPI0035F213DA